MRMITLCIIISAIISVSNGFTPVCKKRNCYVFRDVLRNPQSRQDEPYSAMIMHTSSTNVDDVTTSYIDDENNHDASVESSNIMSSDNGSSDKDEKKKETGTQNNESVEGVIIDDDGETRNSFISEILTIASRSGRGEFATTDVKSQVSDFVKQLENKMATSSTGAASLFGTWELVYSSTQLFRSSPFFIAGRAVCATESEAKQYDRFCDLHRSALALSNIGSVRQIISPTRLVSEFEVKVAAIGFLPITIDGAIVSSADIVSIEDETNSLELLMDKVEIKGSNIPFLRQILDMETINLNSRSIANFLEDTVTSYTNPKPIFITTYLDERYRINRDQDGKIFIYAKVSDSTESTDYSDTKSDLGVSKLLDNF